MAVFSASALRRKQQFVSVMDFKSTLYTPCTPALCAQLNLIENWASIMWVIGVNGNEELKSIMSFFQFTWKFKTTKGREHSLNWRKEVVQLSTVKLDPVMSCTKQAHEERSITNDSKLWGGGNSKFILDSLIIYRQHWHFRSLLPRML